MNETIKEFDDLINIGSLSKDIKIGKHVVTIRTLSYDEYSDMVKGVSKDTTTLEAQTLVIARAINKIDGKDIGMELKMKLLKSLQVGLIGVLTSEYEALVEEQSNVYEEVKKNSSTK